MGHNHATESDTAAWTTLNQNPAQVLPLSFAKTYLTDSHFPVTAKTIHQKVNAFSHVTCFDCHDRSVGGKPFSPMYTRDSTEIVIVHLGYRNITFLDSKTFAVTRQIFLPIQPHYSPIEAWITPDQSNIFITCRNEIGQSKPGCILVVDVKSGTLLKMITAGIYPWHLLPDNDGKRLYVNNFQSSRISIVDVEKKEIVDSLIVQNGPSMMLLLPDRRELAISCFYTDRVVLVNLDTKEITSVINVDANPTSLQRSTDGTMLTVLCGGESSLDVISLAEKKVIKKTTMLFGAYAFHEVHGQDFQ